MAHDIFFLIAYVLFSAYGLMKFKTELIGFNWPFVIGFSSYAIGFVIWIKLLRSNDLSVIFTVASGSLIIATQVTGVLYLSERLTIYKGVGVMLVLLGISVIYNEK